MPRPRTYQEEARTQTITVRVTQGTHARLSAESAQAGKSLAGLAEHYISRGSLRIHAADNQMSPALIAELKRIGGDLHRIASIENIELPAAAREVTTTLRDLLHLLLRDELLSQRLNALKANANDPASPNSRHEFQRVVHVRAARSESQDL